MTRVSRTKSVQAEPVVSIGRTSILILSMFVIGMSLGQSMHAGSQMAVFIAGSCGLLAYVGFEWLARHRQAKSALAFEIAAARLHRRLRRHIPRQTGVRPPRSQRRLRPQSCDSDFQFLPVVTSNNRGH
jgi:hypothetical protein